MAEKFLSERNLKFLLYEVFDVTSLLEHPYYQGHDRETFDMIFETAMKIGRDIIKPCLEEMDQKPPEFVDGVVKVHPVIKTFLKECGEGGWISATASAELEGLQLPIMIGLIPKFIFGAANYSASVYISLSYGAAHLITSFGTSELISMFVPKIFAGQWQGTMALTEPQAGSSLSDITTSAELTSEGYYKMRGQKIFISAGDHDGVENVVHLVLARIKGAQPGVKGISLFVVPKKRIGENGEMLPNDVTVTGVYHKLGYRGSPITQLSFGENDNCHGYLVGKANKGLPYMFQMMNEARIDVGIGATAIASAAYYAALEYAKERTQGRRLGAKDPTLPQVCIIEHADVKRMLLSQRSIIEGSLSLIIQCAKYADLEIILKGEEKDKFRLLLDLLTPVAKSYPSEMGIISVSQALQCLGGYGYCDEFPLEQHYRDMRIHPIHEGTTGIHGITLLGRNIPYKDGKAFDLYLEEIRGVISTAQNIPALKPYALELKDALHRLEKVTSHLLTIAAEGNFELFLADATLYLELFGIITIGWQWLIQAVCIQSALESERSEAEVNFYRGKMYTFRYFFGYELPKINAISQRLLNSDGLTVEMQDIFFG